MSSTEQPLYLEVSRKIEARITTGSWRADERIPGVREIAEEHQVSVVTASRALQVLRDKGIIKSVERSGSYLIPKLTQADESWALCFCITPGPWQKASHAVAMEGFEALGRRGVARFLTNAITLDSAESPQEIKRQVRRAMESGIKGLFCLPSRIDEESLARDERLLQACRELGLPVVLIERNLRGNARELEWDLVGPDDFEGGVRCTEHLQEVGRKRIAFVQGGPTSSHNDRMAGYLFASLKAQRVDPNIVGHAPPTLLEFRHDLPSKQAYCLLAERVIESEADGVICFQDTTAMGLILELLARGKRIPDEVAITGFDDLPIGNSFSIGVTTYTLDSVTVAQRALEIMRYRIANPDAKPVRVLVPGELIRRESSCTSAAVDSPDWRPTMQIGFGA
ncbi:GntR family transcriptional regulator [Singulisphaera sp. PoT]|uniref:GntR family transcriptional regulator n=1 Tax=Singulisphaera sp. PoT TaxID=3411797 RepID=UPI003BF4E593